MEKQEVKKVTFHCPADIAERLDRMAEKGDITRSKLVLNMVENMLQYLELTEKVGVLQISLLIRDLADKMKMWGKKVKEGDSIKNFTKP